MRLNVMENIILKEFADYLNRIYPGRILLVQLFGSRARGEGRPGSDYDILVIIDDRSGIDRALIYDYVLDQNLAHGIDLSLKIYGKDEWDFYQKKGVPFVRTVLAEGHPLWKQ